MPKIKHYKQSRYKAHRKPLNKTAVIAVVAFFVILGASIALGAYLSSISAPDTDPPLTDTTPIDMGYDDYPKLQAAVSGTYPLAIEAYTDDEAADRAILRANGEMIRSLSIKLLGDNGAPSYKSDVYSRIYSAESSGMDLKLFLEKTAKNGISVIGIFNSLSYTDAYADIKEVRRSFELSIIKEAYTYGMREILLCDIPSPEPGELYSFMKELKAACPELVVGISFDMQTAQDSILCAKLDDIFDYIAIDHSHAHAATVEGYIPEPADKERDRAAESTDSESGTEGDTDKETQPPRSELELSLESTLVLCERFGAKVYIDIGDGCDHCSKTAKSTLDALGIQNYIITRSEARHALPETEKN